jgi:MraZ protein
VAYSRKKTQKVGKSGMVKAKGQFPTTLDEKGRVSIPARFREGIPDNVLVLSKSMFEACIWAFTPENQEKLTESLRNFWNANNNISMTPRQKDMFDHRVNFFSCEVELDKTGRIIIPQNLREYAGLTRECMVTSDGVRIEIWDTQRYTEYQQKVEAEFGAVVEKMGALTLY